MPILYTIILLFSASGFFRKFKSSHDLMVQVYEETEEAGFNWVLFSLGLGWMAILFLILHARVKFGLPIFIVVALLLLKVPALISGIRFFDKGEYTRSVFFWDKVDLGTNLSLCSYALYRYWSALLDR